MTGKQLCSPAVHAVGLAVPATCYLMVIFYGAKHLHIVLLPICTHRRAEGLFDNRDHQADMALPPPPADGGGEVDMDIEEGELPGQQQRQQQQAAAMQGYPGYPAQGAGDYYQQQQAGWQQQGSWQQQPYGQEAYGQVRVAGRLLCFCQFKCASFLSMTFLQLKEHVMSAAMNRQPMIKPACSRQVHGPGCSAHVCRCC